jgi:hypothetical protein
MRISAASGAGIETKADKTNNRASRWRRFFAGIGSLLAYETARVSGQYAKKWADYEVDIFQQKGRRFYPDILF